MANMTRWVVIPLRDANEDLAYNGEMVVNPLTGEYKLKTAGGFISPFGNLGKVINDFYDNFGYYTWNLGGALFGTIVPNSESAMSYFLQTKSMSYAPEEYTVLACPGKDVLGTVGDFYINKGSQSFSIECTGTPIEGAEYDYLFLRHSKMPLYDSTTYPVATGIGTFKGSTDEIAGANKITIPTQADTNYRVFITPTENTGGNLGSVCVAKTTGYFVVKNVGSAVDIDFEYFFIASGKNSLYDSFNFPVLSGSSNFNGNTDVVVTFDTPLLNSHYVALIQQVDSAASNVTDVRIVDKTVNGFTVQNAGNALTSPFDWIIFQASTL